MDISRNEGISFQPELFPAGAEKSKARVVAQEAPQQRVEDKVELAARQEHVKSPAAEAPKPPREKTPPSQTAPSPAPSRSSEMPADPRGVADISARDSLFNLDTGTITFMEAVPAYSPVEELAQALVSHAKAPMENLAQALVSHAKAPMEDLAQALISHAKTPAEGLGTAKDVKKALKELRKVSKELAKDPEISADDESLKDAAARIKDIHKQIHAEGVEKGMTKEVSSQLEQAHLVMMDVEAAKSRIRDMATQLRVDKLKELVGDGLSPVALTYYQTTANVRPEEMKEVLDRLAAISDPGNPARLKGNAVQTLHREQIWQTKMNLLDGAIEKPVVDGKPVEIDVEYYEFSSEEMISRLKTALEKGCKVRVLMDPGHIVGDQAKGIDISSITSRVKTISSLFSEGKDKSLGLALFPIIEFLGTKDELMHRKLFRVGDLVVLGGMNANTGSGENIDAAQLIEGPAAAELVKIYQRDVGIAYKTDPEAIYGAQVLDIIEKGSYVNRQGEKVETERFITSRGLRDLLDIARIEFGVELPATFTEADVKDLAERLDTKGFDLRKLVEYSDLDSDGKVTIKDVAAFLSGDGEAKTNITNQGGKLINSLITTAVKRVNTPRNHEQLDDISLPDAGKKGEQEVVIGDSPVERQALVLHAIESAEKFIYIPTFVLTVNIAKALVEKREQMKAAGKDIDIRVVIDSGLYPHGGTPNEAGYRILENAGIPVKWALMWRTSSEHARKIHAKEILTDKLELSGSTNFSEKALRRNWELSGASFFTDDPGSVKMRDDGVKDFLKTWGLESIAINTKELADRKLADVKTEDVDYRKDEERGRLVNRFLKAIENFGRQVGGLMDEMREKPDIRRKAEELIEQGMNEGYAYIEAVSEKYTEQEIRSMAAKLSAWKTLDAIRKGED